MKLRKIVTLLLALLLCLLLAACSDQGKNARYADGTYTGRSSDFQEDEDGNGAGYGMVEVTIQNNKVIACTFTMYELDGTVKDDSYGADLSKENRLKAQKAVQAAPKYAEQLIAAGSLNGVDAISGATISYNEFLEAVKDALSKAIVK